MVHIISKKRMTFVATMLIALAVTIGILGCTSFDNLKTPGQSERRHISLDGQSNFRDMGGYRTADGKTVKWNQLYRSGELPRLSDKDVVRLEKLGIITVINFLTEDEIKARGEDRLPSGVQQVSLPISGEAENDLAKVVLEARQTADFSKVPVELNAEVHRLLTGDASKKQYAALLRQAADPANRPLVFHCSHGVHRTGTAAAILLSALWGYLGKRYARIICSLTTTGRQKLKKGSPSCVTWPQKVREFPLNR
jgi:protein tyrosine/serine phosphatase